MLLKSFERSKGTPLAHIERQDILVEQLVSHSEIVAAHPVLHSLLLQSIRLVEKGQGDVEPVPGHMKLLSQEVLHESALRKQMDLVTKQVE